MSQSSALSITDIYHQGSQWSPEMLVFILHIGVLLCTSILIITFINSLPKIQLNIAKHSLIVASSLLIAFLSIAVFSLNAPGYLKKDDLSANLTNNDKNPISPFGMSSRSFKIITTANAEKNDQTDNNTSNVNYDSRCVFCHGSNLEGIPGLGVSIKDSMFLKKMNVDEIIIFLKEGRMSNSTDSISGGVMPGFSWLPDEEIKDIAVFIKSASSNSE
jgi:cytochrome c553